METKHLIAIEKWTCLIGAVAVAFGMIALSRHAAFSLAVGVLLTTFNAVTVRRMAEKLGAVLSKRPGLLVVLFNLKLGLMAVLIFVALRYLGVDALPFVVGISIFPVAIVTAFLQRGLSGASNG